MNWAGIVEHPRQWPFTGYHEITSPFERYRLINREKLLELLEGTDEATLAWDYASWVDDAIGCGERREPNWSDSIAVGTRAFVENIQMKLGFKAVGRRISENDKGPGSVLHEEPKSYSAHFEGEIGVLSHKNSLFWNIYLRKFNRLARSVPKQIHNRLMFMTENTAWNAGFGRGIFIRRGRLYAPSLGMNPQLPHNADFSPMHKAEFRAR